MRPESEEVEATDLETGVKYRKRPDQGLHQEVGGFLVADALHLISCIGAYFGE